MNLIIKTDTYGFPRPSYVFPQPSYGFPMTSYISPEPSYGKILPPTTAIDRRTP